jgi:hypothetical protein
MVNRIELREYQLESNDNDNWVNNTVKDNEERDLIPQQQSKDNYGAIYSIFLYVITNLGEIEIDYLGKLTNDKDKFDECFDFICKYQGISSTLNRLILEIKNNML